MSIWKRLRKTSIVVTACKFVFAFCSKIPYWKKYIVFESYLGRQYSCNPKAIYEYLAKQNTSFHMVWSVDKRYVDQFEAHGIPYVKRLSLPWFFCMAKASYWVTNSRMPLWMEKPGHTSYVQTWHGTPLKKLAQDMEEVYMAETTTKKYKNNFYYESRKWDYLLSPSAYATEKFKSAFQFEKEIVEVGYPRNDYLYTHNHSTYIEGAKKKLGLPLDKKVILYAPTWRDDQFDETGKYTFDLQLDLAYLQEKLGEDYIVLLRMHYLVTSDFNLSKYEKFVYDVSKHIDINELYLLADMLITDYSSVFFDYANLRKPIIFYTYDIATYRDKLRGFYLQFEEEAPGPIVMTTEEVVLAIQGIEQERLTNQFATTYEDFYNRYCYVEDGQSSKRVVEKIFFREA
ncbi:CDP-glycerol glycerophosphotransferase family protein [Bacillus anthracis]|uniref:CDP-glycerol glycerophosphotransferase family protein n=1 Tax=Bacillus TaxID=1386 RepID=UPI000B5378B1|nr:MULTISPECIES: CDP-glycerol glycerophosphotransferase family protein [Bacillus]MBE3644006.1 CDP-glycerol glycerophosphotransferase family protein [Bacillus anthracis]OWW07885.1 CDP-glycerol--glycerophosphate glycerophosphotransferase [Bacillus sp. MB353a]